MSRTRDSLLQSLDCYDLKSEGSLWRKIQIAHKAKLRNDNPAIIKMLNRMTTRDHFLRNTKGFIKWKPHRLPNTNYLCIVFTVNANIHICGLTTGKRKFIRNALFWHCSVIQVAVWSGNPRLLLWHEGKWITEMCLTCTFGHTRVSFDRDFIASAFISSKDLSPLREILSAFKTAIISSISSISSMSFNTGDAMLSWVHINCLKYSLGGTNFS